MLENTGLLITANKRPGYLRETLASWAACPQIGHVNRIVVALGMSHRWDDMNDVIREAENRTGLAVDVLRDSEEARHSPGMHRALGEAVDSVFARGRLDYLICGEEDVVVSDDVLAYFEWAQRWYVEGVLAVLAHNKGGCGWDGMAAPREDADADQSLVRRLPYFNPWGWMVGRGVWQSVIRPAWDWDCDSGGDQDSGYDWNLQRLTERGGWVSLVPDAARSQTIGEFGGVCSLPGMLPLQQSKSFRAHRDPADYRMAVGRGAD